MEPVSRVICEREFHKLKVAFKKPSVDTCHKCDVLQMQIKVAEENLLASKMVSIYIRLLLIWHTQLKLICVYYQWWLRAACVVPNFGFYSSFLHRITKIDKISYLI